MSNHNGVAQRSRLAKEKHPERYCRARGCLWRTNPGTPCRNHPLPHPCEPDPCPVCDSTGHDPRLRD